MQVVCAWCGKNLSIKTFTEDDEKSNTITHGVCKDCENNFEFQLGVSAQKYIDALNVPICIVDSEGNMLTANKLVQKALGKNLKQIQGYRGGDVFECAYARLPEGCGKTTHCSGCTIRRNVMATFETGESLIKVPAMLTRGTAQQIVEIDMFISTEKVGDVVYLRIDEMNV